MALLRPVADKFRVSQPFGGHYRMESIGYLQSDAIGPRKGMKRWFKGATRYTDLHLGIDYACPVGTPVLAVESGIVVAQGTYWETGEHYVMLLIHQDAKYVTVSFDTHLSKLIVPTTGYKVRKGQTFALSGATGHVSGPHLHHELRVGTPPSHPTDSGSWMRWAAQRFQLGGDLATSLLVVPNVFTG